jgi:hemoglobin-like flavoprotein
MENQGSLEYNEVLFQDTFVPLKASAPYMSELIKESYKQFYRNMLKTNPRFIMTGTSAKIQNQLNDKSKNSLDNLLDSDTFITLKGDTTKADVLNPQVDLANFLKTIGMLIDQ